MQHHVPANAPALHFDADYALILDCPGLEGPEYRDGMKLLFSVSAPKKTGDLCAVTFTSGHRHMMYLETDIPDYVLANLPYIDNSKSDVRQCFLARPLGSDDCFSIKPSGVSAVHRCIGWLAPEAQAAA